MATCHPEGWKIQQQQMFLAQQAAQEQYILMAQAQAHWNKPVNPAPASDSDVIEGEFEVLGNRPTLIGTDIDGGGE